jgi:hypothetical protein
MRQRRCVARHDYGTGRGPFLSSRAGTPTKAWGDGPRQPQGGKGEKEANTHAHCHSRSLHLVQQITHFLEVRDMRTIGVECAFAQCALKEWINEQLLRGARMNLEMKRPSHGALPRL